MIEVRAYAAQKTKADLAPWKFNRRDLGPNDVLVEIVYSGICHSDIHQVREEWGEAIFPMVPGHEIAGIVKEVGSSVTKFKPGMRAGVGVYLAPSAYEAGFTSIAHDNKIVDEIITAAKKSFAQLR